MIWRAWLLVAALLMTPVAIAGVYDDMVNAVNQGDVALVEKLLQRGVDVNTSDRGGDTLVMMAARNGKRDVLDLLLRHKAGVLIVNKYGDSALMQASLNGHLDIVKTLVAAGADTDPEGWTPLIYAAFNGHVDSLRFLLEQDVDIDGQSDNGTTALMAASRNGHLEAVKLLLEREADPDLANQDGKTALDMAQATGNTQIVTLLRRAIDLPVELPLLPSVVPSTETVDESPVVQTHPVKLPGLAEKMTGDGESIGAEKAHAETAVHLGDSFSVPEKQGIPQ